jgi:hypothetical protein
MLAVKRGLLGWNAVVAECVSLRKTPTPSLAPLEELVASAISLLKAASPVGPAVIGTSDFSKLSHTLDERVVVLESVKAVLEYLDGRNTYTRPAGLIDAGAIVVHECGLRLAAAISATETKQDQGIDEYMASVYCAIAWSHHAEATEPQKKWLASWGDAARRHHCDVDPNAVKATVDAERAKLD